MKTIDSISGTLNNFQVTDDKGRISLQYQWVRNIFYSLHKCFKVSSMLFEELAASYKNLFLSGTGNNRIKAYRFAEMSLKNLAGMEDVVSYSELYFKMTENYFSTEKTSFACFS